MEGWVDLGTAVIVQPVPKAAYRSDFRENTNFCPQRDANLGPLAPQASVLPLDHCNHCCYEDEYGSDEYEYEYRCDMYEYEYFVNEYEYKYEY